MRIPPTVSTIGNWRTLPGGWDVTLTYIEQTPNSFLIVVASSGWTQGHACIIQTNDGPGNGLVADARF